MLRKIFPSFAVVALLAPLALAQNAQPPAKPAAKPAPQEKPAEKPAAPAPAMVNTLRVPVSGLTADNADKVKSALVAATNTIYRCSHCKKADAEAGQCCGKDREAETGTALSDVAVDAKTSMVSFSVPAGRSVRLSDVEKALKSNNVMVASDKLQIGSDATVIVTGVADAAAGDAVKKALTEAKLAETADVVTGTNKEAKVTIRKSGMTAPTEARLKEAISKANSSFSVADIVWNAPPKT
jgi:hypothetical protein